MWGVVLELLILVICYFFFPIEKRARTLSFLTKKAYGVVEVVGKGRNITKHLTNFYRDFAYIRGGVYFLDPRFVYVKDGARCIHFDEKDAFTPVDFTSKANIKKMLKTTNFKDLPVKMRILMEEAGIKEIKKEIEQMPDIDKLYLQPVDMKRKKPKEKIKDPQMINAMFMKQKAIAESESLLKIMKFFKIILAVIAVAAVVAAAFGYINYDMVARMVQPLP
jgi:hypothetical protein